MRLFKILIVATFFIGSSHVINAQTKKTSKKLIVKFKPPKLVSALSTYNDSVFVNAGEAENIIALPIIVTDDKKNVYPVTSYQFLYRKNGVTENEETGKVSSASSIISDRFKSSPLPELWISKVREDLKPGEFLYFFDIIVKDPKGRVMYAPALKITVQ